MIPLLKQLYRGLLATLLGLCIFAFINVVTINQYASDTNRFHDVLGNKAYMTEQKERIHEKVDAKGKQNGFDTEGLKTILTDNALVEYNKSIITWFQTGLKTNRWDEAPLFDLTPLKTELALQENLTERKVSSSANFVAEIVKKEVLQLSDDYFIPLISRISLAPYFAYLQSGQYILLALAALLIILLVISLRKQMTLLIWFIGLSALTLGTCLATLSKFIYTLDLSSHFVARAAPFAQGLNLLITGITGKALTLGLSMLAASIILMIFYFLLYRSIHKFKSVVNE